MQSKIRAVLCHVPRTHPSIFDSHKQWTNGGIWLKEKMNVSLHWSKLPFPVRYHSSFSKYETRKPIWRTMCWLKWRPTICYQFSSATTMRNTMHACIYWTCEYRLWLPWRRRGWFCECPKLMVSLRYRNAWLALIQMYSIPNSISETSAKFFRFKPQRCFLERSLWYGIVQRWIMRGHCVSDECVCLFPRAVVCAFMVRNSTNLMGARSFVCICKWLQLGGPFGAPLSW